MTGPRRPVGTPASSWPRLWVASAVPALAAVAGAWVAVLAATGATVDIATPAAAQSVSVDPGSEVGPTAAAEGDVEIAASVSVADSASITGGAASNPSAPETDNQVFAGKHIEIVGDSLVASATDVLGTVFAGAELGIDAEIGRPLRISGPALRAAAAAEPDAVVVALGTNDWDGPADYDEQLATAAADLEGARCVVWVDAQEFRPGLVDVNADIRAAAARYGWTVVAWSSFAGPAELHLSDGYHLSPEGRELYADLIGASVATACLDV